MGVEPVLEQIRGILKQVTLAVEYVLVFVLLAGLAVLFAALQATLDQRLYQGALLRTLGAERALLRRATRLEFLLLGLLAGVMAVVAAELEHRLALERQLRNFACHRDGGRPQLGTVRVGGFVEALFLPPVPIVNFLDADAQGRRELDVDGAPSERAWEKRGGERLQE